MGDEGYVSYYPYIQTPVEFRLGNYFLLVLNELGLIFDGNKKRLVEMGSGYGYNTDGGCAKWNQSKRRGDNSKFDLMYSLEDS